MSVPPDNNFPNLTLDDNITLNPNAMDYHAAFEWQSIDPANKCTTTSSDESRDANDDLWSGSDERDLSATTVDADPNEPCRLEQDQYFAGVRGARGFAPRLIWRDSPDKFNEPSGPYEKRRLMNAIPVQDKHPLGERVSEDVIRWDEVRNHIASLLDEADVKTSSCDFVCFTWLNPTPGQVVEEDKGEEECSDSDEEVDPSKYDSLPLTKPLGGNDRFYSNPTIWIGVLPDTLTATRAMDVAKGIRAYLDGLNAGRIDIAFREQKFKFQAGPALYSPVEQDHALETVVDKVSVTLSRSIQGLKTSMQGTLGPYFRAGNKLYAITVRHNVFALDDPNVEYRYNASAPKKEVITMSDIQFTELKISIQRRVDTLQDTAKIFKRKIEKYKRKVADKIDIEESTLFLQENEADLTKTERHITELKKFYIVIEKKWCKRSSRVIGHVVWSPPLATGTPPHKFTCDLAVIELNKPKFKNLLGNVLCLGTKYTKRQLTDLIYTRIDVPSEFKYPDNGLLYLKGILAVDDIGEPNSKNSMGDPTRRVLKDGCTTSLTIGSLGKFKSLTRKYFPTGVQESVELTIFNHEDELGPFSNAGDSGSLVVDICGRFVALLTGGSDKGTVGSDITYATPFEWVWKIVCDEFPGATLDFGNLDEFFSKND